MAHHVEPMDVDNSICDFDNKENSIHHSNVLAKGPCTEKGYEEIEVSELNMKLRYSITPTSSPMSKSFTANCLDNKLFEAGDNNITNAENANLTRSMNATITRSDSVKKVLPLQSLPTDQFIDGNRNALRSLEPSVVLDKDVTITVSGPNDLDEHLLIPSSSSSLVHTPEATTPTKELIKQDGGSPIMRGLKSVLSMFRPSQSPVITTGDDSSGIKPEALSPPVINSPNTSDSTPSTMLVSTPLAAQKTALSKRETLSRDSIVFKDDMENELEWKEESVFFSTEKIPIHKLFMTQNKPFMSKSSSNAVNEVKENEADEKIDSTLEYMDISYGDLEVKTVTGIDEIINKNDITNVTESFSEFLDCETSFTRNENKKDVSLNTKQDSEVKEGLNMVLKTIVTNESLTHNSLTISTERTKESVEKEKVMEEQVDSAKEEITDNQMINTCVSTVSLSQPEAEPPSTLKCNENHTDSYAFGINNVQNIETTALKINNEKNSENIVLNTLSPIPLIADPPVLPFSIPDETSKIAQISQDKQDLTATAADIPLPDDDDLEKVEADEKTGTDKQDSMKDNLKIHLMEQKAIDERLVIKTSETVSSSEEILVNNIVEYKRDQSIITQPIYLEQEVENEKKDIVANVSTYIMESLPELDQVAHKDNTLKQYVVNEVASTHEVIPSHNGMCYEHTNDNSSIKNNTEHTDLSYEGFPLIAIKEMSPSSSEIEHHSNFIQNETKNVTECDFTEVKVVEIIPAKSERVQDEKINTVSLPIKEEKENFVKEQKVQDLHSAINETDISYSIFTAASEKNPGIDEKFHEYSSNNFKEDNGNEVTSSIVDTILEKEKQEKETTHNIIAKESRELVQFNDQVAVGVTENNKEIVALTTLSMLNSISQEETSAPKSIEALLEETSAPNLIEVLLEETSAPKSIEALLKETSASKLIKALPEETSAPKSIEALLEETSAPKSIEVLLEETSAPKSIEALLKETSAPKSIEALPEETSAPKSIEALPEETSAPKSIETLPEETSDPKSIEALPEETSALKSIETVLQETSAPKSIEALPEETSAPKSIESLPEEISAPKSIEARPEETILTIETTIKTHVEEEIVASKDNSPFLVISSDNLEGSAKKLQEYENFENIDNPNTKKVITLSPPLSPKISSKGYDMNFDEIEDPFATRTKISLSPSRDSSPNKSFENIEINVSKPKSNMIQNRCKPARRPVKSKKMNTTISGSSNTSIDHQEPDQPKVIPEETTMSMEGSELSEFLIKNDLIEVAPKCEPYEKFKILEFPKDDNQIVNEIQDPEVDNVKNSSSSELSTYQSAETSLCEVRDSKNVFNLPEIDDASFNPLVTKSNFHHSPVPSQQTDDSFMTKTKNRSSPERKDNSLLTQLNQSKSENTIIKDFNNANQQANFENKCHVLEEQNLSNDTSNTTCSSKETDDKDTTVHEVHTEDEDTIEGPFLETVDLNHDDKMADFGGENLDMMQFSELPIQESENQEAGELFIDAEAFEFLLNQNKVNEVADSGKESLFLKFDPLYAKRMSSDGVVAALSRVQKKKQSTPKKIAEFPLNDITFDKSPVSAPSTMNVTHEIDAHNITEDSVDDLNITVTKPMMVVNPAVNPIPAPRNKAITPVRSNRQSLTFTSPAIAVIDRLLSMSANNSLIGHEASVTEVRGHSEADLALTQLRELLADKEISVYNLKTESKELKERLSHLESQMKNLEAVSEERLKKINNLTETLVEKTNMNKSMASVVEEYERTIASLIAETEQDRKRHAEERLHLISERDEQTRHLASMEVSFSDLHSKYEKSKQVIFGFKTNEDSLKKSIKDFEENLAKMQNNYELLKQHATSKLNHANEELQKMNRAHETDVLKLNAMIKRQELHITSLEETLLQKTKANEELTAICDELINRVG